MWWADLFLCTANHMRSLAQAGVDRPEHGVWDVRRVHVVLCHGPGLCAWAHLGACAGRSCRRDGDGDDTRIGQCSCAGISVYYRYQACADLALEPWNALPLSFGVQRTPGSLGSEEEDGMFYLWRWLGDLIEHTA